MDILKFKDFTAILLNAGVITSAQYNAIIQSLNGLATQVPGTVKVEGGRS